MKFVRLALLLAFAALTASCASTPLAVAASGPFAYSGSTELSLERIVFLVSITSHTQDDVQINPADFVARDIDRRIYLPDVAATTADARLVRLAGRAFGLGDITPLPVLTLRQNDTIVGFVVFAVPAGVRPIELVWRQSDGDRVVELTPIAP